MSDPNTFNRLLVNQLSPSARSLRRFWACLGLGLTLGLGPLALAQDPRLIVEPDDTVVSLGADVSFQLRATASSPLWLQWYHTDGITETALMGTNILGRTSTALTLTQVELADEGGYYAVITNDLGSVTSRVGRLTVDPTFIKITSGAMVTDFEGSLYANWADYDGDGYLDMFVANSSFSYIGITILNALYRNNGDGTFTRNATSLPAIEPGLSWNGLWVDYDNDGDLDLHVLAALEGAVEGADRFYRNDGQGVFTKVEPAFVTPISEGENATWCDFDNDGWLDVFIPRSGLDLFYRGLPGGEFQSMNAQNAGSVVAFSSYFFGLPFDYDDDGWTDLLVVPYAWGSGGLQCRLHRNEGHGLFRQVTEGPLANQQATFAGDGLTLVHPALGDFDNDGDLDLVVVNGQDGYRARLYRNDGDGTFTDVAAAAGVDRPLNTLGAHFIDYDNDGHLDLFVLCQDYFGDPLGLGSQNVLFRNRGDGTFESVEIGSPLRDGHRVFTAAWADYDNNGLLDLFVSVGNANPEVNLLYRNNLQARDMPNRWLKVRLRGHASNSMGVGAKIRAEARIGGIVVRQLRQMMPAMSFTDQAFIAHFGLGDATQVDTLRIEWPSGIVQELKDVAVNQQLQVVESQGLTLPEPLSVQTSALDAEGVFRATVNCPVEGAVCVLESSANLDRWTKVKVGTVSGGTVQLTDAYAAQSPTRFYRVLVP